MTKGGKERSGAYQQICSIRFTITLMSLTHSVGTGAEVTLCVSTVTLLNPKPPPPPPHYSRMYLSRGFHRQRLKICTMILVSWRKPIMMKTQRLGVGGSLQVGTITAHTSPKLRHLRFHGNDCLVLARLCSHQSFTINMERTCVLFKHNLLCQHRSNCEQ